MIKPKVLREQYALFHKTCCARALRLHNRDLTAAAAATGISAKRFGAWIRRYGLTSEEAIATAADAPDVPEGMRVAEMWEVYERDLLVRLLAENDNDRTRTAKASGIPRRTICAKVVRHGLPRGQRRVPKKKEKTETAA